MEIRKDKIIEKFILDLPRFHIYSRAAQDFVYLHGQKNYTFLASFWLQKKIKEALKLIDIRFHKYQ